MNDAILRDFCEFVQGGRHKLSGKDFVPEGYPAYGAGGLNGFLKDPEFDRDAIVLSSIGARCGKCFLAEGQWASLANTQVILPDLKKADVRFLWYQLNDEARWPRHGLAQPFIRPSDVKSHAVYLPPLDEQRRIAAILDKADSLRRKRSRGIELLNLLVQSIFSEMFEKGSRFEARPLAEIVDPADRINYGVVQPGDEVDDGVPLVRVSDLRQGRIDHTHMRSVSYDISASYSRSILRGNEILVSCVGSIGEIAIATPAESGFNIARAVARIPISSDLLRIFVAEYLRSQTVQRYFTKELRTVSQPTLNIKQISETLIPMPSTSMMHEFATRREKVQALLQRAMSGAGSMNILFSSLRARAFSGQL